MQVHVQLLTNTRKFNAILSNGSDVSQPVYYLTEICVESMYGRGIRERVVYSDYFVARIHTLHQLKLVSSLTIYMGVPSHSLAISQTMPTTAE